jgi:hypothetical protein
MTSIKKAKSSTKTVEPVEYEILDSHENEMSEKFQSFKGKKKKAKK